MQTAEDIRKIVIHIRSLEWRMIAEHRKKEKAING
jgi:hypothetical protein